MNKILNKRAQAIIRAVVNDKRISALGEVKFQTDPVNTQKQIIRCTPHEGVHKGIAYLLTLKHVDPAGWPRLNIESPIYDPRKTRQLLQNKGRNGDHKGICFIGATYGHGAFKKHFKKNFDNNWSNYLYQILLQFNNPQSIRGARGLRDP